MTTRSATIREERRGSSSARRPHLRRVSANLLPNASISEWPGTGRERWHVYNAVLDDAVSHSGGSASLRLDPPETRELPPIGPYVTTPAAPVVPGRPYTFAWHMMSSTWPPPAVIFWYLLRDENDMSLQHQLYGDAWHAPWDAMVWSEAVGFFVPPPGVAYIRLKVGIVAQPVDLAHPWGSIWLDDFYVGEGIGFEGPPEPKTSFKGKRVRVDALGNMRLREQGGWKPFFPILIYPKNRGTREDYRRYAEYGFNTVNQVNCPVRRDSPKRSVMAAEATSQFQPNGLLFSFSLDRTLDPEGPLYGDLDDITSHIDELSDDGMLDRVVMYNWDNEHFEYDVAADACARVRERDPDAPIYSLNSREGLARMYANDHANMIDLTGEYLRPVEGSSGAASDIPQGLLVLDRLEGMRNPPFIMQLNGLSTPGDLRTRVYAGLILGARGLSVYADDRGRYAPPIEETEWLEEMKSIRREIDALLPLIRQPHFTDWSLDVRSNATLFWGTRDMGHGYVILVNTSGSVAADATITPVGLGYRLGSVRDFFSGSDVGVVHDDSFSVSLMPQRTAVLELKPGGS